MRVRFRLLAAVGRSIVSAPDRTAHALVLRDLNSWLRLEFLGVASRVGIADALDRPRTLEQVADVAHITDVGLLEAFLQLGVALGEVRFGRDRYEIGGRRLRAVAGESVDLRGLVEEVVTYDSPIYTSVGEHLRGLPPRDYLDGVGDVIAQSSRIAEPVLAPAIRFVTSSVAPRRVLDVGCGSGVYLGHVLDVALDATAVGIDPDEQAISTARDVLAVPIAAGRCELHAIGVDELSRQSPHGRFDLVLLLNNIYYWPPDERADILSRLRALAPDGTVVVATATASAQAFNRHLDLVLRVTKGSWRLPTAAELDGVLRSAGFANVELVEPVPRSGVLIAIAS